METNKDIKNQFEKWLKNEKVSINLAEAEKLAIRGLKEIGIELTSIYDEPVSTHVRLFASDLVMKRSRCGINNIQDFSQILLLLVSFADYLDKGKDNIPSQQITERDKTLDSLTVAYYLSRVDIIAVHNLGYKTFSEAFKSIGKILDQKPSTIKNMRDEFDPYFDNGRAGWYQRELRGSRKTIYDLYKKVSDQDLFEKVKTILSFYMNDSHEESKGHKKIIIKSQNLKEIKPKKK